PLLRRTSSRARFRLNRVTRKDSRRLWRVGGEDRQRADWSRWQPDRNRLRCKQREPLACRKNNKASTISYRQTIGRNGTCEKILLEEKPTTPHYGSAYTRAAQLAEASAVVGPNLVRSCDMRLEAT